MGFRCCKARQSRMKMLKNEGMGLIESFVDGVDDGVHVWPPMRRLRLVGGFRSSSVRDRMPGLMDGGERDVMFGETRLESGHMPF